MSTVWFETACRVSLTLWTSLSFVPGCTDTLSFRSTLAVSSTFWIHALIWRSWAIHSFPSGEANAFSLSVNSVSSTSDGTGNCEWIFFDSFILFPLFQCGKNNKISPRIKLILQNMKSSLHLRYCCIKTKRVTSGEVHLRGLASGQHSSEETSQRWQAVGNTVSDLTGPGIEPQTSCTDVSNP